MLHKSKWKHNNPVDANVYLSFLRHNEDGSYSYGYEAADGSFKLETRYPDGRVKGKYGYVDIHTGELKVGCGFVLLFLKGTNGLYHFKKLYIWIIQNFFFYKCIKWWAWLKGIYLV